MFRLFSILDDALDSIAWIIVFATASNGYSRRGTDEHSVSGNESGPRVGQISGNGLSSIPENQRVYGVDPHRIHDWHLIMYVTGLVTSYVASARLAVLPQLVADLGLFLGALFIFVILSKQERAVDPTKRKLTWAQETRYVIRNWGLSVLLLIYTVYWTLHGVLFPDDVHLHDAAYMMAPEEAYGTGTEYYDSYYGKQRFSGRRRQKRGSSRNQVSHHAMVHNVWTNRIWISNFLIETNAQWHDRTQNGNRL